MFKTTCACGYPHHSLTVSVDKDVRKFNENDTSISIDMELFFETQWNDKSSWDYIKIYPDDPWYSKIIDNIKMKFSSVMRFWNRIKTAFQILTKGYLECDESFLFRSGEQAEALYKAIGDAIESFRNGEKEIDTLCDKYKNITKSKLLGS